MASPYVVSVMPFMRTPFAHYTSGPAMRSPFLVFLAICAYACGSPTDQGDAGNDPDSGTTSDGSPQGDAAQTNDSGKNDSATGNDSGSTSTKVVFVIPLENKGAGQIYGNMTDAPYINGTLMQLYPHTTAFADEPESLP